MTSLPSFISLKCYKPNGTLRYDYTRDRDLKLVTTAEVDCGFAECDFDLCDYANRLPLFGDMIVVKNESKNKICWLGEPEDITKTVGVSAHIKCLGYGKTGAFDLPYAHGNVVIPKNPSDVANPDGSKQVFAAGQTLYTVVSSTLTRTQNIFEGDLTPLNDIALPEDTRDYIGLAPGQIWNEVIVTTSSFATPLGWFVLGSGTDGQSGALASLFMRYMDFAARYRVKWDNKNVKVTQDSYERSSYINGCTVAYGSGLQFNAPDDIFGSVRNHSILPTNHDRDKFVSNSTHIKSTALAQQLAESYLARFSAPLRSSNARVTICGVPVVALPPLVPAIDYLYPIELVLPGWVIDVQNMPGFDAPYNWEYKFINRTSMDFTKYELTLETGEPQSQARSIAILETYLTSRPYQVSNSGQPSSPYSDSDTLQTYGPPAGGGDVYVGGQAVQNSESTGLPKFINNSKLDTPNPANPLLVPYDGVIDPRIVADYGVKGNFGREADST